MNEKKLENIDKYGRNVYLPEHIKKIEIDTSDVDSFMEKIQDFSEQDQSWLIKRLLIGIEDAQIEIEKGLVESMEFWLDTLKHLKIIEKENPDLSTITIVKEMRQDAEKHINSLKEEMKDEI